MNRGGKRPNSGRKKGQKSPDIAKNRTIRLTDTDNTKFHARGGIKWLRSLLNE